MSRGFTLVEVLVLMSIIAILFAIAIPAITGGGSSHQSKTLKADVDYYTDNNINTVYIGNDKRSSDMVTLKRHTDGILYACNSDDVCKQVKQ